MSASFEERSVWIQLLSLLGVLGGYFAAAGVLLSRGVTQLAAYVPLFVGAVVLMVAVLAVGHVVAALAGRTEPRDERDRLIGWRAESRAGWVLGAGVLVAITGMVLSVSQVWIAHLLLFALFASEVLKYTLQLVYYRRGF